MRSVMHSTLCGFAMVLLTGEPAWSQQVTTGFDLRANLIVLDTLVNGSSRRFVLDTGAGGSIIASETAAELGLDEAEKSVGRGAGGDVTLSAVRVDSLAVNGAELENLTCMTMDLADINARIGGGIDGILGYDFLSQFKVTIDYEARKLTLDPYLSRRPSEKGFRIEGDRYTSLASHLSLLRPDVTWSFTTDTPLPRIDVILEKNDSSARVTLQHQNVEGLSLEQLLPSLEPSLRVQVEDFEILDSAASMLGGLHAHRIEYRGREDGLSRRYRFVVTVLDGKVISFTCRADETEFATLAGAFDRIIESVTFDAP